MSVSLLSAFQARFPDLWHRVMCTGDADTTTLSIAYRQRPEVEAWISSEAAGFIVGIGFLHSHFDSVGSPDGRAGALAEALDQFEAIVRRKRAAAWDIAQGEVVASCAAEDMDALLEKMGYGACEILLFE